MASSYEYEAMQAELAEATSAGQDMFALALALFSQNNALQVVVNILTNNDVEKSKEIFKSVRIIQQAKGELEYEYLKAQLTQMIKDRDETHGVNFSGKASQA